MTQPSAQGATTDAGTPGGYSYRPIEESDTDDIVRLLAVVQGVEGDSTALKNRYFGSPAGAPLSVAVLSADNELVGHFGAVPIRYVIDGREAIVIHEQDIAVLEAHRRFDVYLGMFATYRRLLADRGITLAIGFPNKAMSDSHLTGHRPLTPVPRLIRILNPTPFVRKRLGGRALPAVLGAAARTAMRMRSLRRCPPPGGMHIERLQPSDPRLDKLWERVKGDYTLASVRDSAALAWRYAPTRTFSPELFALVEDSSQELRGYVALAIHGRDPVLGDVHDLLTPRSEDGALSRALLGHALDHLRKQGVAAAYCWMHQHTHPFRSLRALGFVHRPSKDRAFHALNLDPQGVPQTLLDDSRNWFISKGDSDIND